MVTTPSPPGPSGRSLLRARRALTRAGRSLVRAGRSLLRAGTVLVALTVLLVALAPPWVARAAEPVPPRPPRPPDAGIPAPGAHYAWPLAPVPAVTGPFRAPTFRYGRGHRGADLAGAPGQPVLVARDGVVVHAGPVAGRGVVSVDHPDGLRSTYEPVTAAVATGARVASGDPVGVLEPGHGGCPVAACLHWGVRRDRLDHLDPLVLLRPPRMRLLPWDGAPP
ncbi:MULTISPECIES: M23 family metallopeptidase [unclassified Pseudonocardia]|uniref:M23 family metallopeptidase n=1 Tax=unclassified Pseudonocardia TaxID=2619320 RepID=UPI000A5CB26D|nr:MULTISPECIES: M23 family metallopeptidase [unclassified Pseudonocardia]